MTQEISPPSLCLRNKWHRTLLGEKYAIILRKCEYRCLLWRRASYGRGVKLCLKAALKRRGADKRGDVAPLSLKDVSFATHHKAALDKRARSQKAKCHHCELSSAQLNPEGSHAGHLTPQELLSLPPRRKTRLIPAASYIQG